MNLMCTTDMLGVDNAKKYLKNHENATDKAMFEKLFSEEWQFISAIDPDVRIGYYISDTSITEDEAKALGEFIQRACGFPVLEVRLGGSQTAIEIDPDGITDETENTSFPITRVA